MIFSAALAPVLAILFYIYIRDKYEREPLIKALTCFFTGGFIAFPIIAVERIFSFLSVFDESTIIGAFYTSFVVASFTEETFKLAALLFLVWKSKEFDERFDGIVYSVFISIGFAGFENFSYVFNTVYGGLTTAIMRAVFSVPAHGLFGVVMGYYFAKAKFNHENKYINKVVTFLIPFLYHGIYDFLLFIEYTGSELVFFLFVLFLWINGFVKIKKHISLSPFKLKQR